MKRHFLLTLLIGILSQLLFAQDFDKARLDDYFDTLEVHNRFMGSVAVSQHGEIIYTRSVGYADVENAIKANEHSKYRIGSISKTFTAVLLMKAVEENLLDLNQTIDKFFPEIVQAENITIRHLLSHRSGIHNFTNDEAYLSWNTQPKTESELREIIAAAGIDFEPGSKASYSNSNFVLLTFILEKSFGKSYRELLTTYITEPLQLENTFVGGKINTQNNECKSYSYLENWKEAPETDLSIPLGAGAIVSTPVDMVKFSDALFGGKLLKKEGLDLMKEIKDNFGLGLLPIPFYDNKGLGHTGGIDGFSSVFCHFGEGNVSYAMTVNGANYNTNNISIAVLSAVYNRAFDIPAFNTFEADTADLDKLVGIYASAQLPLKITVTRVNKTLIAQATGQSAFPLEATGKNVFTFEQAGVIMEFMPDENKMVLKQGGGKFDFKKD